MRVFAIGDLHLPGGQSKPMDIFGAHWEGHFQRISEDWKARVGDEDLVLIPGDISWAMQLAQAQEDLQEIQRLPGKKVILRGNHDYWWSSITQLRAALPEEMYALQNDAMRFEDVVVCGSRGWICPVGDTMAADDRKIYERELQRLQLSIKAGQRLAGEDPVRMIVMMHFPPFADKSIPSGFTQILEENGIPTVLYGHLHGPALQNAFSGPLRGVCYHQISSDGLGFKLHEVFPMNSGE